MRFPHVDPAEIDYVTSRGFVVVYENGCAVREREFGDLPIREPKKGSDVAGSTARDRGGPDAWKQAFIYTSSSMTFTVDVDSGKYAVTVKIGDNGTADDTRGDEDLHHFIVSGEEYLGHALKDRRGCYRQL